MAPRKKSKKPVIVEPKKPARLSTGGMVLPELPPVAPLPKGQKYDPLELGRGLDTAKPPRRVIGPHGIPPRGLTDDEKRIHFHEGMGSVESRKGVAWDREYKRRMKGEQQRENVERDGRFGVDVTPTDSPSEVRMPWGLRERPRSDSVGPRGNLTDRYRIVKDADGVRHRRLVAMMRSDIGRDKIPASKQA